MNKVDYYIWSRIKEIVIHADNNNIDKIDVVNELVFRLQRIYLDEVKAHAELNKQKEQLKTGTD
jgi:hypothetical protein